MPTVKTGYWVRVNEGKVEAVWDYDPPSEHKVGAGEWLEAVEIFPDVIETRETITTHGFDVQKTPVEITWSKRELDVDERKEALISLAVSEFNTVVQEQLAIEMDATNDSGDMDVVAAAKAVKDARIAAIKAATTHEEVDAL
jgi:hypothetical protein